MSSKNTMVQTANRMKRTKDKPKTLKQDLSLSSDRRKYTRVLVSMVADLTIGEEVYKDQPVTSISEGGIFTKCRMKLRAGQRLSVELRFPFKGREQFVAFDGKVVRYGSAWNEGFGIEIATISNRERWLIRSYVQDKENQRKAKVSFWKRLFNKK